jgi:hypothetical protein
MATLGTFVSGQVLTAAELNDIGTWTDYTPTVTFFSGSGLAYTINVARYCEINKLIFVNFDITITAGTSLTYPRVTMPSSYTTGGGRGSGFGRFSDGNMWVWDIQTSVTGYRYDGNGSVASGVTMHGAIHYEES